MSKQHKKIERIEHIDESLFYDESIYKGYDKVRTRETLLAEKLNELIDSHNAEGEEKNEKCIYGWVGGKEPAPCSSCGKTICPSNLYDVDCPVTPKTTPPSWEEEFEKKYLEIGSMYGKPVMGVEILKDFIRSLLISERKKLAEKIERLRDGRFMDWQWQMFLDEVLSLLEKEN